VFDIKPLYSQSSVAAVEKMTVSSEPHSSALGESLPPGDPHVRMSKFFFQLSYEMFENIMTTFYILLTI